MQVVKPWYHHTDCQIKTVETEPPRGVLALSGGGVRGICILIILADLEKRIGKKAGDIFSFMGATSVGCIISALLNKESKEFPGTRQYSAKDLIEIIEPKIKEIFNHSFINSFETAYSLYAPKYTSEGMDKAVDDLFHETLAKDLMGNYCFTSFDTTDFKHAYMPFSSQEARTNPFWQNLKVKDMLSSVTAAPTYFPPRKITLNGEHNIIDGGLATNNPSLVAYAGAKNEFDCGDNMILFSVGTGFVNYHVSETNWGSAHWAPWILPSMFAGSNDVVRDLADQLLNRPGHLKRFYEAQFELDDGKDVLDDTTDTNLDYLKHVAHSWIESTEGEDILREVSLKLEACANS